MFLKSHAETNYCLLKQMLRHGSMELGITSNFPASKSMLSTPRSLHLHICRRCPTLDCRVKDKNDRSPFVSWRSLSILQRDDRLSSHDREIDPVFAPHRLSVIGRRTTKWTINSCIGKCFVNISSSTIRHVDHSRMVSAGQPSTTTRTLNVAPYDGFGTTYDCSQGCYTQSFPGLWTIPIHMYQDFGKSTSLALDHPEVFRFRGQKLYDDRQ